METIWYIILIILIGTYVLLDGYDLGTGISYLFFAPRIKKKKKL